MLSMVKKKELSGVSNPSWYVYHQVPSNSDAWVGDRLLASTVHIPISAENLVSQGRKVKMRGDIKAVLQKGDKGCLLLESGLLQFGRGVNCVNRWVLADAVMQLMASSHLTGCQLPKTF